MNSSIVLILRLAYSLVEKDNKSTVYYYIKLLLKQKSPSKI